MERIPTKSEGIVKRIQIWPHDTSVIAKIKWLKNKVCLAHVISLAIWMYFINVNMWLVLCVWMFLFVWFQHWPVDISGALLLNICAIIFKSLQFTTGASKSIVYFYYAFYNIFSYYIKCITKSKTIISYWNKRSWLCQCIKWLSITWYYIQM